MRSLLPVAFLCLLFEACSVNAVIFPIQSRTVYKNSTSSGLRRRGTNETVLPVLNTKNSEYISNITLGGRLIPVLLDTGSSDLWVAGDVPSSTDLGVSYSIGYAVGTASGNINTATLEFGNYTVEDQAFLLVKNASSFSINITSQGFEGLIGLGPNTGSEIRDKIGDSRGDSVLDRIFQQNASSSNYLTILLNREGDPASPSTGQVSISDIVPGYETIESMPKLLLEHVHKLTDLDQHWQAYTDVDGVIGPDGNPIKVDSIVPSAPDGQLVAVFDSGYTLPQVPREMSDAIYGRVQGAEWNAEYSVWTVPCTQLLNISFKFGGQTYPVHPLDVSSSDFDLVNAVGETVCLGTFQPISTSAFSLLGEYDMILGMAFMRNVYAQFDYGDFVEDTSVDLGEPFVRLLSTTNVTQAHDTFVQVRLSGVDTTGESSQWLLPASKEQHSPESEEEKKQQYEEYVLSRWPEIFVGCLVFVLLVVAFVVWRCCIRKRAKKAKGSVLPSAGQPQLYRQLDDPSSMTLIDMSHAKDKRESFASAGA
ncbi:acid protease [Laetiporus sulphureus 93-53]|uniref:Acid protease n=1 Tax=Laetiporus sulphureus 93-53 TaxID=1314785 RepID=A0A165FN67_9APHY|nr:acid protease [Laetiporus sulphureus 93-53]KZT09220.1 acid protease [Laetiporus sulphureus 93-53]